MGYIAAAGRCTGETNRAFSASLLPAPPRKYIRQTPSDAVAAALAFENVGEGLGSNVVWTARGSDTHFVIVDGSGSGMTDGKTVRAQTQAPGATPGISPTVSPPPGTALTFASVSAGGNHTCGVTTSGAGYCWGSAGQGRLGYGSARGRGCAITRSAC